MVMIRFTVHGGIAHGVTTACTAGVEATTMASTAVTAIHHGLTAVR